MKVKLINSDIDIKRLFKKIDCSKAGISIMKDKTKIYLFYIKNLKTPAANILKQDALSINAELAVSKDTITCRPKSVDAVLIANLKQLKLLAKKEKSQPFELKNLSKEIEKFLKEKEYKIKIMGVLNANEDSFYEGSRFSKENAKEKILSMIEEGADIIDIGGVSSRPGSEYPGEEEEFRRVKPIIDIVYENSLYQKALFSLDSYSPKSLVYALDRGFKIVNDITALSNDEVAKIAASYRAKTILMHMRGTPKDMQKNPFYEDVIIEVEEFFQKRIEKALSFGIDDIVLDVGIGFGKRLEDNIMLLKHLKHFKKFGFELLIGASRKSMIDKIYPSKVEERLPATLILHQIAIQNGASIIRVHDVKEHKQAIEVYKAIKEALI